MTRIAAEARTSQPAGYWLTERPVAVTILYFPDARMTGDVDNIVKPILDALSHVIYVDDHQVNRVLVQKFEPDRIFVLSDPTPKLIECAELTGPRVYIRVDDLGDGVSDGHK